MIKSQLKCVVCPSVLSLIMCCVSFFICSSWPSTAGADINSQAADGATALYEAAKNEHRDIVEFLISQKADANKPGKTGLLPLHVAAQTGNEM